MENSKRIVYLDFLRIFSIVLVVYIHTAYDGYLLYTTKAPWSLTFFAYTFISVCSSAAVPIFFAVSGAVLLGKSETIQELLFKRVIPILITLIVFSIIYYLNAIKYDIGSFSMYDLIVQFFSFCVRGHLWYLYAYIAYLLSLPLLRALVKSLYKNEYKYWIILVTAFSGIIPIAGYLCFGTDFTLNQWIQPTWLLSNIVIFPCVGYFISSSNNLSTNQIINLWIVNIVGIVVSCVMTSAYCNGLSTMTSDNAQVFLSGFTLLNAISIFVTAKYYFQNHKVSESMKCFIKTFGKATFGIYLLHLLIMDRQIMYSTFLVIRRLCGNQMIGAILYSIFITICSFAVTYVLSKIPLIKKFVGY